MTRYVALLRGINVGGNNKLPMKDLAGIFEGSGCKNVQTYIQSGNVLFECAEHVSVLQGKVGQAIEKKFGFNPPFVVRKLPDLEKIVRENPFLKDGAAEQELHVVFLESEPAQEEIAKLKKNRVSPDEFAVHGKEIYLRLPNGAGRSKLAAVKLKTLATGRNWRTVNTLVEMLKR